MGFAVNVPITETSFGQIGIALLREIHARGAEPAIFPMVGSVSLSSQETSEDFERWLDACIGKSFLHNRKDPCFRLWHLADSLQSVSEKQMLLTFYETDQPTPQEINVAKNNKTFVSNTYTADIFKAAGAEVQVIPLGFDSHNFRINNKKYFDDDRITFSLCGKFEKRKHHKKIIQAWIKKYGNDRRYYLQCALWNGFLKPEKNQDNFNDCLNNKSYYNVQFLGWMSENKVYNDFLNSGNIVIGMSGGEGWGLPEFQSVALGKHAVVLNAHGYKEWADGYNSVLVEPSGKISAVDDIFFKKGAWFNQGSFFDWDEDAFIDGCERAINRYEISQVNEEGKMLQRNFTYSKMLDKILEELKKI
jgi:glycosyltransferase involved in cell wall biosynthesis